jgi:hypothetical protein
LHSKAKFAGRRDAHRALVAAITGTVASIIGRAVAAITWGGGEHDRAAAASITGRR